MLRVYLLLLLVLFPAILGVQGALEQADGSLFRLAYLLLASLGIVAFLVATSRHRRLEVLRSPPFFYLALMLSYFVVQTWTLEHFSRSFFAAKQFSGLLGLIVTLVPVIGLGMLTRSRLDLQLAISTLRFALALISGSVLTAAILYQFGLEFGEVLDIGGIPTRFFGPLGDQVGFISALGFFLSISSGRWSGAALHLCAVMFTGTRGILPVLGIGVLFFAYSSTFHSARAARAMVALRLVGSMVLLVGMLLSPVGETITERITNPSQLTAGVSYRGAAFALGIEIFTEHPIFGVGYAGYTGAALDRGAHLMFRGFQLGLIANSANPYLDVAVSGGIIGLLLYLLLLGALWRQARRGLLMSEDIGLNGSERRELAGVFYWFFGMVLGLHSVTFALPLSLILVFLGVAIVLVISATWVAAPESREYQSSQKQIGFHLDR